MWPRVLVLAAALAGAARAVPEHCGLPKARGGTCAPFAVRYYFDTEYGGCLRFWYGGCEGNGNRFNTEAECERACVRPAGDALCRLPAVRGACKRAKARWYSDPSAGGCRQFTYSGCLGNENRFETEAACQQRCGRVSPDSGTGGSGGGTSGGVAPPPPQPQPGPADCLLLDRVAGACSQYVIRYSYVAARQQCAPFYYGGCGGNANRFDTSEACHDACVKPPTPRPPYYAPPSDRDWRGSQTDYGRRAGPDYGAEERTSYRREETSDDDREDDREEQPSYGREERPDSRTYERTSDDREEGTDSRTYGRPSYGGEGRPDYGRPGRPDYGRQDGRPDYGRQDERPDYGRQDERPDYGRQDERPDYGREEQPQPTEDTPETEAPSSAAPEPGDVLCSLRSDPGRCRAYIPSYYFNAAQGRCERFIYGGCGGNENRFSSMGECEQRCGARSPAPAPSAGTDQHTARDGYDDTPQHESYDGLLDPETGDADTIAPDTDSETETAEPPSSASAESADVCSLPSDSGRCRAYQPHFYFNSARGQCERFIYGGCGGNGNRFVSMVECEQRCGGVVGGGVVAPWPEVQPTEPPTPTPDDDPVDTPTPSAFPYIPPGVFRQQYDVTTPPPADVCSLPPTAGPCRERLQRYYFNSALNSCFAFTYSGCGGNGNRFSTPAECAETCLPDQPTFAPFVPDLGFLGGGGGGGGAEGTTTGAADDYPTFDYEQYGAGGAQAGSVDTAPLPADYYDQYYENYEYK